MVQMQLHELRPPAETLAFSSLDPAALPGVLWIDPTALITPAGAARALRALADFDAFSAAAKAFLINHIGQQIAEEPLEGRDGQPTRLGGEVAHAVTVSEVAGLLNLSEAAAARAVNFADALLTVHPAVHEALLSGDITEAHAKVIVDQAATLPAEAAEMFGTEALSRLHTRKGHPRTPGELRSILRALRERLHPESITHRNAAARADRGIWLQPEPDGMCTLTALLPAEIGHAVYRRIDSIAQSAHRQDGEHRTTPQLRADVLAQLALTIPAPSGPATDHGIAADSAAGRPEGLDGSLDGLAVPVRIAENLTDLIRADVVVHLTPRVLLGPPGTDDVAELEGHGVIDARTARQLAAAAPTWTRLWTDDDGVPLKLGRTAYRPTAGLRKFIAYRDGTCVVPGCTRAAHRCEVDHTVEWQDGGTTGAENLALLCPKHHALKSLALFRLRRGSPDGRAPDGGLVWETLLGNSYPAEPQDRDHILGPSPAALPIKEAPPEPRANSGTSADPPEPAPPCHGAQLSRDDPPPF